MAVDGAGKNPSDSLLLNLVVGAILALLGACHFGGEVTFASIDSKLSKVGFPKRFLTLCQMSTADSSNRL